MELKEAILKFTSWRSFKVKEMTVKGYDKELKSFCLYLHNPHIESISINDVMDYFNDKADLGWQQNSFIGTAMALRKFFEFYRMQNFQVIDEELIPIPRKEYKLPRVAGEEDYQKLLRTIPRESNDPRHIRNLAFINLLWDTGARNGELLSLDLEDLQLDRMKAIINTEKTRGRRPFREIFWTAQTNENLKRWIEKREHLKGKIQFKDNDAVFIGCVAQHYGIRLKNAGVGEFLRRYANRAKLPYLNAHSFRHHMGHDIIKKGGSAVDVMNILGHSTLASSSIYTMMTDRELEQRYRMFKEKKLST